MPRRAASAGEPEAPSRLSGSEPAVRLLKAQAKAFPDIIDHLRREGPGKWRKRSHWAWYAFPTTLEGASDMKRTAVKHARDAMFVLDNAETREMWTTVLIGITGALKTQSTRKVMPSIDNVRVDYFIADWRDKYGTATRKHVDFHQALHDFCAAWEDA